MPRTPSTHCHESRFRWLDLQKSKPAPEDLTVNHRKQSGVVRSLTAAHLRHKGAQSTGALVADMRGADRRLRFEAGTRPRTPRVVRPATRTRRTDAVPLV